MIGIHVLPQQRDFTHAALDQIARLVQNAHGRAAHFGPPGIRHHAKGTELVAPFLHCQEGGRAACRLGARFQMLEFVFFREIRVERLFPGAGFRLHLGQAVIALGADHQIDSRLAAHDFSAFGLCDAPCHPNLQVRIANLERLEPPKFRIDLFSCLFTDVTGIQQDHIRIFSRFGFDIALCAQAFSHALTVIDIHLAAICLDKQLFLRGHGGTRGSERLIRRFNSRAPLLQCTADYRNERK